MADATITDEWLQLYEESLHAQDMLGNCSYLLSDATAVATSFNSSIESIDHSPTNSTNNTTTTTTTTTPPSSGPVTPNNKKATCFSKPIRRRSRASKKTPTTHLNANTSNFRALVQKFTGCHKKSISFGAHKTPINLNFKLGRVQNHRSTSSKYNNNMLPNFGENCQFSIEEQPQIIGWPMEQPRVDLQLHGLTREENNCMASVNLLNDHDHQMVEYNIDHPPMPNNLEVADDDDYDDGFLWDDFDLHEYPILEESFSSEIVDCCYV